MPRCRRRGLFCFLREPAGYLLPDRIGLCDDAVSRLPWWPPLRNHRRFIMRRRSVLLSAVSGALAGALVLGRSQGVAAPQEPASLADHPLTGDWMAMANQAPGAPQVPAPSHFGADGSVLFVFPPTQVGMGGVDSCRRMRGPGKPIATAAATSRPLSSSRMRTEPSSAPSPSMATGSERGRQTFVDDGSKVMVTIRDATGAVVQQMPGAGAPPVTGMRMAPGIPGFPGGTLGRDPNGWHANILAIPHRQREPGCSQPSSPVVAFPRTGHLVGIPPRYGGSLAPQCGEGVRESQNFSGGLGRCSARPHPPVSSGRRGIS